MTRRFREVILTNKALCMLCSSIIESTHVHDFKACSCGAIFVDGGREYLRRGGKLDLILELSVTELVIWELK